MDVIGQDLGFPEGPVVMADGSVIVVEVMGQRVTRCWAGGRKEVVCAVPGGPNGAAIGPDGALWLCNNGGIGYDGPRGEGRIERIDLATGRLERVWDSCAGEPLGAPNDLVFDAAGQVWFTDMGPFHWAPWGMSGKAFGGLCCGSGDGSAVRRINRGAISYNGVGLSPDGRHVYVADTYAARVYRFDARAEEQTPRFLAAIPGDARLDSLAITAAGNLCVATLMNGGISTVTPAGQVTHFPIAHERHVTNIAFGGADMRDAYVTLSGRGEVVRLRWAEPGLKLHFNA